MKKNKFFKKKRKSFCLNKILPNLAICLSIYVSIYCINSRKKTGGTNVSSVNQLENNDRSGNKESVVYCLLTFDF